ncbi:MAG: hypothetical protein Q8M19_19845 [Reyranella sp.]|nr:hypothetical protein [Reyranella sp.]
MAQKPGKRMEYVLFNVTYEDGSQRSNRRVPLDAVSGDDTGHSARAILEAQDREVAAKSGKAPLTIKGLERVGDR